MTQRVDLRFNGQPVRVPRGVTLFDAASWNGIAIDSTCGGHGTCKKCRIRFRESPPAPTSLDVRAYTAQEIKDGWRLACRTPATGDADVEVPPLTTRPKAAMVGVGRQVILRPAVSKRYLELAEPSLADQVTDLERVLAALTDLEPAADLAVLATLGPVLRQADFKVTAVVVDDRLIAVEPGDTTQRGFGLAFDLGTTTVVATLLDLTTGTPVAVRSMLNKQQPFGADVITRISATMLDPAARDKLQQLARETLAELAAGVCEEGGVQPGEVYEVALAGNATMVHLVLGMDPEPLGVAPFIMAARLLPEIRARDLGVPAHPGARAVVFPAFGAYVGGDITAGLLASGMDRDPRIRLFIDIGTNCAPGNQRHYVRSPERHGCILRSAHRRRSPSFAPRNSKRCGATQSQSPALSREHPIRTNRSPAVSGAPHRAPLSLLRRVSSGPCLRRSLRPAVLRSLAANA
jgi:uncharacterized 2Fe-2S/4Fe-4S cluster protein (DUF4445 family)